MNTTNTTSNLIKLQQLTQDPTANRIAGMIIGCAVADAVGLQAKFEGKQQPDDIVFPYDYSIRGFSPCDWTENTDFMLITAQNILKHDLINTEELAKDFTRWMHNGLTSNDLQGVGLPKIMQLIIGDPKYENEPITVAEMIHIHSKGTFESNSSLTRACVCALLPTEAVATNAARQSQLTHVSKRCQLACAAHCLILNSMLYTPPICDTDINAILNLAINMSVANINAPEYTDELYAITQNAYSNSIDDFELDKQSNINYVYKCLSCSIYALDVIKYSLEHNKQCNFKKIIKKIASAGGDADANCAVVGCIMGSFLGFNKIMSTSASAWVDALPDREFLFDLTNRLICKFVSKYSNIQVNDNKVDDNKVDDNKVYDNKVDDNQSNEQTNNNQIDPWLS